MSDDQGRNYADILERISGEVQIKGAKRSRFKGPEKPDANEKLKKGVGVNGGAW